MEHNIRSADRVLIVCSTDYVLRTNNGRGGVDYERLLLAREILRNTQTMKLVPILRDNPKKELPGFMGARKYLDFDNEERFESSFKLLLSELLDGSKSDQSPLV